MMMIFTKKYCLASVGQSIVQNAYPVVILTVLVSKY